jgi:hypothetical protein
MHLAANERRPNSKELKNCLIPKPRSPIRFSSVTTTSLNSIRTASIPLKPNFSIFSLTVTPSELDSIN